MFLTSCSSHTLDDFRDEGEGIIRNLIVEFKQIRSRDDLLTHAKALQQLFNSLVDVIIEAQKYKIAHPEAVPTTQNKKEQAVADQLRIELNRILHMEGGREVIEKVQEEALNRLDSFERTRRVESQKPEVSRRW